MIAWINNSFQFYSRVQSGKRKRSELKGQLFHWVCHFIMLLEAKNHIHWFAYEMITLRLKRMIKERMGMTLTLKTHRNVSFWRSLDRVKYCLLFNFSSIVQFHSKTWKRTFKTHQIWVNKSTFLLKIFFIIILMLPKDLRWKRCYNECNLLICGAR